MTIMAGIRVGRRGDPWDVARTAVFPAKDKAGFITGATFTALSRRMR